MFDLRSRKKKGWMKLILILRNVSVRSIIENSSTQLADPQRQVYLENPCSGWALSWVPNSNLPSREPTNPEDGDMAVAPWKKSLEETVGKRLPLLLSAQIGVAMSIKIQ